MLTKPVLARCDNRNQLAKINPVYGEPDQWLSSGGLAPLGLSSISFDFFIDWNAAPLAVGPELWVKRIAQVPIEQLGPDDVLEGARACGDDLLALEQFAAVYGCHVRYLVFRDDVDWQNAPDQLLVATLENGQFLKGGYRSLERIEEAVRRFSGGAVRIGAKQLTYGTSTLECYLAANTDALWPGDADCVLWSAAERRAIALLEFKKHNLDTPLADENIQKYMRNDVRKWQRLALLRDRIQAPLFCVYYPTNERVDCIKIERLAGPYTKLSDRGSRMVSISGMPAVNIGSAIVEAVTELGRI